jgi:hypothetical protein
MSGNGAFAELGHLATGLEGAAHLAAMARANSGCEVWQQDFLKLDLPDTYFDGVFANASLFHVPSQELPRVARTACMSKAGWRVVQLNPRAVTIRKATFCFDVNHVRAFPSIRIPPHLARLEGVASIR